MKFTARLLIAATLLLAQLGGEPGGEDVDAVAKERPDALFVYPDPIQLMEDERIAQFALKRRLPTMNAYRESVDAGGLMSYGATTTTCSDWLRTRRLGSSRARRQVIYLSSRRLASSS